MKTNEKQVNIRLPAELADWLKVYAKQNRRSVTNLLTVILEQERNSAQTTETN
ncbi:ribbon-helix-helix domain-containing protein [Psychrobacter sanguinis]|uniref:ribbon-helix-helix domain-containing protein n=1 Tax=Psychrobacter sanguinis TaxID=861445 RepID=UPI001919571A|nr:Arc family DNA-binding protein [Psychrobacter sanguinis]MCC3344854.1 Arc family DNA-binding protein [Psychrobacter sanguinis]